MSVGELLDGRRAGSRTKSTAASARRQEPRDDIISSLAQAEIDGERLSDEEIFSFLRLLLPGSRPFASLQSLIRIANFC
jgi:cytochrome P450